MTSIKRTIFLGAGASIPFFEVPLTTQYLTGRIKQPNIWEGLIPRYNRVIDNDRKIELKVITDFIDRIKSINRELDFERIIEIIDKVSSYNFDPNTNEKIFHNILRFYEVDWRVSWQWDGMPFLSRQLIAEQILEVQKKHKVKDYNTLVDLQSQFFKYATTERGLSLVSLNYDDIVFDSIEGMGFETGFSKGGFDISAFFEAKKTVSFLHGHIRFSLYGDDIKYHDSSDQADQERLGKIKNSSWFKENKETLQNSPCYNFNTFIVTGQSKELAFNHNPYAAYYHKLAFDIATSNEIIIVGYSFGDDHFNR
jgi:hypothetical protein